MAGHLQQVLEFVHDGGELLVRKFELGKRERSSKADGRGDVDEYRVLLL